MRRSQDNFAGPVLLLPVSKLHLLLCQLVKLKSTLLVQYASWVLQCKLAPVGNGAPWVCCLLYRTIIQHLHMASLTWRNPSFLNQILFTIWWGFLKAWIFLPLSLSTTTLTLPKFSFVHGLNCKNLTQMWAKFLAEFSKFLLMWLVKKNPYY